MAVTMNLTISVPTQEEVDDFCIFHGWESSSGITKSTFAKQVIARFIKNSIANKRAQDLKITLESLVIE